MLSTSKYIGGYTVKLKMHPMVAGVSFTSAVMACPSSVCHKILCSDFTF